jgi:hypothetical protein
MLVKRGVITFDMFTFKFLVPVKFYLSVHVLNIISVLYTYAYYIFVFTLQQMQVFTLMGIMDNGYTKQKLSLP